MPFLVQVQILGDFCNSWQWGFRHCSWALLLNKWYNVYRLGIPNLPTEGFSHSTPLGINNQSNWHFSLETSYFLITEWDKGGEVPKEWLPRHYLRSNLGPCIKQVGTQKARNSKCVPMSRMLYNKSKFWRDRRLRSQNSVQIVLYFRYYPLSQCWIPVAEQQTLFRIHIGMHLSYTSGLESCNKHALQHHIH